VLRRLSVKMPRYGPYLETWRGGTVPPGTVRSGEILREVLVGSSCGKFLREVLSVDPSGDGVPSG